MSTGWELGGTGFDPWPGLNLLPLDLLKLIISLRWIDCCTETWLELSLILIYSHLSIENQMTKRHNFRSKMNCCIVNIIQIHLICCSNNQFLTQALFIFITLFFSSSTKFVPSKLLDNVQNVKFYETITCLNCSQKFDFNLARQTFNYVLGLILVAHFSRS